jgi:hypothetical protein
VPTPHQAASTGSKAPQIRAHALPPSLLHGKRRK